VKDVAFQPSQKKSPTLAEIAAATGVSVPTVSKVVNGRKDVADETRAKVLAALDNAGYQKLSSCNVSTAKSSWVEVVFDALTPGYSDAILDGILDYAAVMGIEVSFRVVGTQTSQVNQKGWIDRVIAEGRSGLIVLNSALSETHLSALHRRQIPVAIIDPGCQPPAYIFSVGTTNWAGAKAGVEHLLKLGHRDIAYLGGLQSMEYNQARLHGYMAALDAAAVGLNRGYILHGNATAAHGVEGLRRLLSLPRRPTAVFAGSDRIAVGIMQEARRHHIRIPDDLSLISFGGTSVAENSVPPLTSVSQPLLEMGRAALRAISIQLKGEELDPQQVELGTKLDIRQSAASRK
jgi:LacI family transcriptional regulator